MANTEEWLRRVESKEFLKYFGSSSTSSFKEPTNISSWDQPQGFGLDKLKTCPSGFPKMPGTLSLMISSKAMDG